MLPLGLEQGAPNTGETPFSETGGAESDALGAQSALIDPELLALVEAWPELPEAIKANILAMVRSHQGLSQ